MGECHVKFHPDQYTMLLPMQGAKNCQKAVVFTKFGSFCTLPTMARVDPRAKVYCNMLNFTMISKYYTLLVCI